MSEGTSIKPPLWFWIAAGVALVWNLLGVGAYVAQVTMSQEALAALPEAKRALYEATPTWATGAFAIAVFGGAFGCLLLLLRKSLAMPILIASLVGVLVQMYYNFFMAKTMEVYGPGSTIMPIMVVVVAILLILLSRSAIAKNWIK